MFYSIGQVEMARAVMGEVGPLIDAYLPRHHPIAIKFFALNKIIQPNGVVPAAIEAEAAAKTT